MRTVIGGNGQDTTAAVKAYLLAGNQFTLATLYLFGTPDNPAAIYLTDWSSPLLWTPYGTFQPGVISRGTVESKIGFDSPTLDVTWTPVVTPYSANIASANPWQLVQQGYFDNLPFYSWTVYMPTAGDANTYGCSQLFGGVIGKTTTDRAKIVFSVDSFLYVTGQQVPTNVVELLNTVAAYTGATPPAGFATIPQFNTIIGDSNTVVEGQGIGSGGGGADYIYGTDVFQLGYMVFNGGPGSTLAGVWSAIQQNKSINIGGHNYNQFILYAPLPWPPTPVVAGSGDTFYVSAAAPINQADGEYFGFPYVPAAQNAI